MNGNQKLVLPAGATAEDNTYALGAYLDEGAGNEYQGKAYEVNFIRFALILIASTLVQIGAQSICIILCCCASRENQLLIAVHQNVAIDVYKRQAVLSASMIKVYVRRSLRACCFRTWVWRFTKFSRCKRCAYNSMMFWTRRRTISSW